MGGFNPLIVGAYFLTKLGWDAKGRKKTKEFQSPDCRGVFPHIAARINAAIEKLVSIP